MAWARASFFISAKSKPNFGSGFTLYVLSELTLFFALAGAALLFPLHVFRLINHQTNFFYRFFAVLNCCIGERGFVL